MKKTLKKKDLGTMSLKQYKEHRKQEAERIAELKQPNLFDFDNLKSTKPRHVLKLSIVKGGK